MIHRKIMRLLSLALACCLLLPGLAGCSEGRVSASGSAPSVISSSSDPSTPSEPSGPQSGAKDPGANPQPEGPQLENTVLLDGQPVPAFLDEEQQRVYLDALLPFEWLTLSTSGFGMEEASTDDLTLPSADMQIEVGGIHYHRSTGKYTTWQDFEAAMLAVFTPEYFAQLNDISYTDGDGVFHQRGLFIELDGNLYYSLSARGSHVSFKQQLGFREVFRSPDTIVFNVVGEYYADPYKTASGDETYTRVHSLVMELAEDSTGWPLWRFSLFALPY